ncbi:hypothetical protein CFP56_009720 [Quercus suber]|uniref:Uncharacterized protein n=1 Tax=Quercus suber TaxID=58331 RepID=A0AAW0L3B7_QUESU
MACRHGHLKFKLLLGVGRRYFVKIAFMLLFQEDNRWSKVLFTLFTAEQLPKIRQRIFLFHSSPAADNFRLKNIQMIAIVADAGMLEDFRGVARLSSKD